MTERVLTKAIAEQFRENPDSVDLRDFELIEDAAAEALAEYKGDLWLRVTTLSEAAAEALAIHEGHLSLDFVTTLPEGAAKALAKRTDTLWLQALPELSD
jgi:alpha-ketoglutarate-dependent taurine dioxygenase